MSAAEIKSALIAAHRAQDWPEAARLSQLRQRARKRPRCIDCGVRVVYPATRCQIHDVAHRFYHHSLADSV